MALTKVQTTGLADDAVTSAKIADDAVIAAAIADDAIVAAAVADDAVGIAQLSATGTAGNTTFLRGDNSWQVVDTSIADDSVAEVKLDIHNAPSGTDKVLGYTSNGMEWTVAAAGATGGGTDKIFWENGQTVTTNYTITNNNNAGTFGPVTINSGVTVTIGDGEYWTII